jgi:hypothetical protein
MLNAEALSEAVNDGSSKTLLRGTVRRQQLPVGTPCFVDLDPSAGNPRQSRVFTKPSVVWMTAVPPLH